MADPIYRATPVGLRPEGPVQRLNSPYTGNVGPAQGGTGLRFDIPRMGGGSTGPPQRSVTGPRTGNR